MQVGGGRDQTPQPFRRNSITAWRSRPSVISTTAVVVPRQRAGEETSTLRIGPLDGSESADDDDENDWPSIGHSTAASS